MRIVLATSNPGKIRELQSLLAPLAIEVLPQSQFTGESVAETGLSFVENAIIKARHASLVSGLAAVADDSGIEVDALRGGPGIYSARYAGVGATDQQNLDKLIDAMKPVPEPERTARYRCALVYMRSHDDASPIVCQAAWEGHLLTSPRGAGGFGYDPIFELPVLGMTAAQLPADKKNELSHRGQALRALIHSLRGADPSACR